MFLITNLIKTNKNHLIPFLKEVKNYLNNSHGKDFFNLPCSPHKLHHMTPFTTTDYSAYVKGYVLISLNKTQGVVYIVPSMLLKNEWGV